MAVSEVPTDWEQVGQQLGDIISANVSDAGMVVAVKSDISGEVLVYNKDKPASESNKSFLLPNVGVNVYSRYGKLIANYGGNPKFNILKAGVYYGTVFVGALLVTRGLISYVRGLK